jgi:hypothetical protein
MKRGSFLDWLQELATQGPLTNKDAHRDSRSSPQIL